MSLLLLKELIIIFLFGVTAAGVVPCGIPKKRPRTSSIVQFIFYFWSFEISRNILRNQKTLSVKIHTAALTYYYDPAILQNKLTPLSIFRDLALRKGDSKKFLFYFYVFYMVHTNIQN